MNNLLALLRGSHKPDVEALSELADGRLDPALSRALETHMAACAVCAARLGELRRVKTMLAAMPQADAPRSFRLRRADVETPARPAPVFMPGLLRALPAASGIAALAFVLVLATDFSTRGGDGGRMASIQSSADGVPSSERIESKSAEAPAGAGITDRDDQTLYLTPSYFDADVTAVAEAPAVASAPEDDGEERQPGLFNTDGEVTSEAGAAGVDAPATGPMGGDPATAVTGAIDQYSPPGTTNGDGLTQVADEFKAATAEAADDDDDGRTAFLAVEIIAASVAIAAGAAFAVSRSNRRVQS